MIFLASILFNLLVGKIFSDNMFPDFPNIHASISIYIYIYDYYYIGKKFPNISDGKSILCKVVENSWVFI